ncbi:MAG: succinate dehydrogenase assembly factor 2 [Candidatus Competibacteraceae bacterium]|nr:succinate dehydrogenase assembly factor 2 [Candidatus Competibacteraceae bacterium]
MSELSRLRWRCRRGMKELDIVMLAYLERHYETASVDDQRIFEELLDLQDPQLYAYLLGRETPADAAVADVVNQLRTILSP